MLKTFENTVYLDAQRYDDEYWWKTNDLEFWKRMLRESSGNKVLEIAAGTGRIAIPLVREGANYTGLELSKQFVNQANQKLKNHQFDTKIVQGDMRDFNLNEKYDLIFIGFNSFLHLLNDDDANLFFQSVKKHMHENTKFIIDIFTPNPLMLYRPENMKFYVMEYVDSITNAKTVIEESNIYDTETNINQLTWHYIAEGSDDIKTMNFFMRMYWPDTMNRLLIDAGFEIEEFWGDYNNAEFDEESILQIYVCKI
jgi:2-polyprenyl-3-methyl-5-hydroxy-6-metoxy-1,4-benzoquinol methylase